MVVDERIGLSIEELGVIDILIVADEDFGLSIDGAIDDDDNPDGTIP